MHSIPRDPRRTVRIVGLAGGSASGKTTIARRLVEALPGETVILPMDAYYRDRPDLEPDARSTLNFDHPDAIDLDLLTAHVRLLAHGRPVDRPVYCFTTHRRAAESERVSPGGVVILEGLHVLSSDALRRYLALRVFVDTPGELRLERRLRRDVKQRGRSEDAVRRQFARDVAPMHEAFVEPSRRFAQVVVDGSLPAEESVARILERWPRG